MKVHYAHCEKCCPNPKEYPLYIEVMGYAVIVLAVIGFLFIINEITKFKD